MGTEAQVYAEAFVEVGGWRWRVCESDPGLIEIQYQEWNEERRQWLNGSSDISFQTEYADAICKAIQRVKSGV
jgi:hypothetical protein